MEEKSSGTFSGMAIGIGFFFVGVVLDLIFDHSAARVIGFFIAATGFLGFCLELGKHLDRKTGGKSNDR